MASGRFLESDIATWSDADYRRLLAEIEPIFLAKQGTPDGSRRDVLFDLIEAYEQERYQIAEWLAKPSAPETAVAIGGPPGLVVRDVELLNLTASGSRLISARVCVNNVT